MPGSDGWQIPPLPDRAFQAAVHPSLISQKDGGRPADAEIANNLLDIRRQILRTDPQCRGDRATADCRQPPAELVPELAGSSSPLPRTGEWLSWSAFESPQRSS